VLRGVPGSSTTNLAFGGADRHTLYVTDSTHGRILRAAMDAPGTVGRTLDFVDGDVPIGTFVRGD